MSAGRLYRLGPLLLDPEAHVLTRDGAAMPVGARGVAVLAVLVGRANEYVTKSAILDAAWPGLVVEEANLTVQISAIRRALAGVPGGEGWIETLARRGYRFVGPVIELTGGLANAGAAGARRSNLAEPQTSFVGREREVAEIKRHLAKLRLLTLVGTGGIGKTRLAQQVAAEVLDAYRDGVWFVDLAPLSDATSVPGAVAQVLDVKEPAGQRLEDALCGHLRTRECLLILDNCEHVLDACGHLADRILREAAHVSLIATSREPLRVAAEHTYPLAALGLPDPSADAGSIAQSDAVQLFVERARRHRPQFDLQQRARAVAELCVRLDGIPLALELAAARVAALPVEQIVRLLDQRFRLLTGGGPELPRHRTLRATIDWSYDLLDEAQKTLFARLSVFAGGWTLAAAEAVCGGAPLAADDVVYLLIALIEKSLVVADADGDRFRLLDTIRQYAAERLTERGGGPTVGRRHREYFVGLAEGAEPLLGGAEQADWLVRLEQEHGNLRAALAWSLGEAEAAALQRLCGALQRFWWIRGHFTEGRAWCARALESGSGVERTPERAKVLNAACTLAQSQGDYRAARALGQECLAIRRELGDRKGIAACLNNLGLTACDQGDYAAARALHEESIAIKRELGDRPGLANSLNNLANVAYEQGDLAFARSRYEDSLAIARELGDREGVARVLGNLGNVALHAGDRRSARRLHEESLAIKREIGHRQRIAGSLISLGNLAMEEGAIAPARALYREGLTIGREVGDKLGIVNSLAGLAAVEAAAGHPLRAATLWGAEQRLRAEIDSPVTPKDRTGYERRVGAARAAFGVCNEDFDRAWEAGAALALDQALALALEDESGER